MQTSNETRIEQCRQAINLLAEFSNDLKETLEVMNASGVEMGEILFLQKLKKLADFSITKFPKETLVKQFPELLTLYGEKGTAPRGGKMFDALA